METPPEFLSDQLTVKILTYFFTKKKTCIVIFNHFFYYQITGLLSGEVYIVSIVAVDGEYMTESDPQEIETSNEGPIIQPKENVATAGWFIGNFKSNY